MGYLFEQRGQLFVTGDEDSVMLAALDGGADDVTGAEDQWEVVCAPGDLQAVRASLEEAGVRIESGDVTYLPSTSVAIGAQMAPKVLRLVDALEDLDDVQSVFANFDIPDEVFAALE